MVQGVAIHNQVTIKEEEFHALNEEYFSLDKKERFGADGLCA